MQAQKFIFKENIKIKIKLYNKILKNTENKIDK